MTKQFYQVDNKLTTSIPYTCLVYIFSMGNRMERSAVSTWALKSTWMPMPAYSCSTKNSLEYSQIVKKNWALCISAMRDRCQWHENCKFIHKRHSHQLVYRHVSCLCRFIVITIWKVDCLPKLKSEDFENETVKSALLLTWLLFKAKPEAKSKVSLWLISYEGLTLGNRHAN